MNFDWTPEEQNFKSRVAGLLDAECRKELAAMEHAETGAVKETVSRFLKRLAAEGYLDKGLGPEAHGDALLLMAGREELAAASGAMFLAVETSARLFGGLVAGFGSPELKDEILSRLTRGELIAAVAMSEPASLTPGEPAGTGATRDGDYLVVTGEKSFVTNGPIADYVAVSVVVEGAPAVAVAPASAEGLSLGERKATLGYNGLTVCGLTLDRVRVPASHALGPFPDSGPLEWLRSVEDFTLAVASLGLMKRSLAEAKRHADSHHRDGKPVAARQEVRFKLADMVTLSQTSELLARRAAWMTASSHPEAPSLIRVAKVFIAEAAEKVAAEAMQIMAGRGYLSGNPVEAAFRDSKYAAIAGTTSERARMAIADELLRLYRV